MGKKDVDHFSPPLVQSTLHAEREKDRRSKRRDEGSRSITEKFKGINYGQAAGSSRVRWY